MACLMWSFMGASTTYLMQVNTTLKDYSLIYFIYWIISIMIFLFYEKTLVMNSLMK